MSKPIQPKKVIVKYEDPQGRPFLPVNGAHGGPAPNGNSVVVHLYAESGTIPPRFDANVASDGSIDFQGAVAAMPPSLTRHVVSSIVMSPEDAVSIGSWLVKKGTQALEVRIRVQEQSPRKENKTDDKE
jgi:hypothetical protein